MRLKPNWRNWRVSETTTGQRTYPSHDYKGGGVEPPPNPPKENPKRTNKKSKPNFFKGKPSKNKTNQHITSVTEKKFYEMPEDEQRLVDRTSFPHMLDWSKTSGLNRGMVDIANDMNQGMTQKGRRLRRLGNYTSIMIGKFAEDQCGNDIYPGNEFWDEDALLNRVLTKVPIHICRKDRELDKVILILDTSPSCSDQALLYANIAKSVVGHGLVEMYDAPNAYITRKFCPVKKKFVEFMDADEIVSADFDNWQHWKKRHIIFFGDTDGWSIVHKAMKRNTVHWFMNIDTDDFDSWHTKRREGQLARVGGNVRKRIFTDIYNEKDFINAIKRLK